MGILDVFSKKRHDWQGKYPGMKEFLAEHQGLGHRLYVAIRSNGRRVLLAFGPLKRYRNKYKDEVEDGVATIFVEGETSLTTGEWWQGTSAELSWDGSKPVGRDPFTCGEPTKGTLKFTRVGKEAPFHNAHGLTWWSDGGDGKTLRTRLGYKSLPESRLIWHLYEPDAEDPAPIDSDPGIEPFVGVWTRSHSVEGEVVVDPTEGSGFSVEGAEYWLDELLVWPDGTVTLSGDESFDGHLRGGVIQWDHPVDGDPPEGERSSIARFQPYDGPVELDGNDLVVGGYRFGRVLDTEPE